MNRSLFFTLLILLLAVGGWYYLYFHTDKLKRSHTYYGYYSKVKGLQESAPVLLHGVKIGKVAAISLYDQHTIKVVFAIKKEHPLPEGSVAVITNGDISGTITVRLVPGESPQYIVSGSQLATATDTSMAEMFHEKISPILNNATFLLGIADTALINFHDMLMSGLGNRTRQEIDEFHTLMAQLATASGNVAGTVENLIPGIISADELLNDTQLQNNTFNALLDSTAIVSSRLSSIVWREKLDSLSQSMHNLRQAIQRVNSSDDKRHFRRMVEQLDTFSQAVKDFEKHPPGFSVFGGKKKK